MKRSCRFGLRLGGNLVIAVVALGVLFMALEAGADSQEYEADIVRPQCGAILSGATYYPILKVEGRPYIRKTATTRPTPDPTATPSPSPTPTPARTPTPAPDADSQAFAVTLANSAASGNAHADSPDIHSDTY